MKTPARFQEKDVTIFRPIPRKHSAAILVNMKEYHLAKAHAGKEILVAQEPNGDLFGLADTEGNDITFITLPNEQTPRPERSRRATTSTGVPSIRDTPT